MPTRTNQSQEQEQPARASRAAAILYERVMASHQPRPGIDMLCHSWREAITPAGWPVG